MIIFIIRASETMGLECGIKGTQWLRLTNVRVNETHKSYCQHEVYSIVKYEI